jgi:hypothetical protein
MKRILVSLSVAAMALALPAAAQMAPKSVVQAVDVKVKSGMQQQFEAGVKKLRAWQKENKYPFASYAWQVITGDRGGTYVFVSDGHDWKDFDEAEKLGQGSSKIVQEDIVPNIESAVFAFWQAHPKMSSPPMAGQEPPKFMTVVHYSVKLGHGDDFRDVIKQVNDAIEKTHWPGGHAEWYSLINGGEAGQWVVTIGHKNWADFKPAEPPFDKMLSGVYGKVGLEAIGRKFDKSVLSERTEILRYHPELGYTPSSQ